MRKIINSMVFALALLLVSCEDGQFQGVEDMWNKEVIYSSKIDYLSASVGYERLKIYFYKLPPTALVDIGSSLASSKPLTQVFLANARKIVVKYDDITLVYDEITDAVIVPNLLQKRLYRFYIHTMDEYGNLSVPITITGIPYVQSQIQDLSYDADTTMTFPSAGAVSVRWPRGINNQYYVGKSIAYSYTDKSGTVQEGFSEAAIPIARLTNLQSGSTVTVHLKIMVIPYVNKVLIMDEVPLEADMQVIVP